jgi:AhpD family alkylhydroperoxidase
MNGRQPGAGFRRRIYASPGQLVRDLWRMIRSARAILALSLPGRIAPDFRERIMLAVTGVNRCRHCAWGHQLLARQAGVSQAEIAGLLRQDLADCPDLQVPGLLFAIHWAETDGAPSAEARAALAAEYGGPAAAQIETAAMLINAGNRFGNTFDLLLSRISRGRCGLLPGER